MDFFVNVESAFSPMLVRRLNTWFSINNGNWSDPNTWIGNDLDKKSHTYPQPGDNVWINNTVTCDINATVGNLYGNGYLSLGPSVVLTVNGDIQITGTVDQTASLSNLILNGYNNIIVNYSAATNSTLTYNGTLSQPLMNLPYGCLSLLNSGFKYQISDITVNGTFSLNSPSSNPQTTFDSGNYNFTVNGTTAVGGGSFTVTNWLKSGASGSFKFVGVFGLTSGKVDWSANNPNIEFRGGVNLSSFGFIPGTGTMTFSTNNQTFNIDNDLSGTIAANWFIKTGITVTFTGADSGRITGVINGESGTSTLNNNGSLTLFNTTYPMATGVFNYMAGVNSGITYSFNANLTLPYTSYANLTLSGTGTKTLAGNTTINKSLIVQSSAILETSSYSLTVTTTTLITGAGFKSSTTGGSHLFIGSFTMNGTQWFDLSGGNPNMEFRGGGQFEDFAFVSGHTQHTGTGTVSFTTNNQTIKGFNNPFNFEGPVIITGAITVQVTTSALQFSGTVNGSVSASTLDNRTTITYNNATAPMVTGKLFCNQAANTFIYGLAGNQDITTPSDATPGYQNLTLSGSGAKRLLGNVSVKATYTLTGPATLNSNGFSLTNP